ncbi:HNH endonuclease [Galactobacter valiniphilus]|uniref:HNH endonuclease n=1 Tax=Galactobacter valiniphilus TaxID=2676122 RepID=UPI0037357D14
MGDNFLCHLCGLLVVIEGNAASNAYATLDHLIPYSDGGTDTLDNLLTAHAWCNSARNTELQVWNLRFRRRAHEALAGALVYGPLLSADG